MKHVTSLSKTRPVAAQEKGVLLWLAIANAIGKAANPLGTIKNVSVS